MVLSVIVNYIKDLKAWLNAKTYVFGSNTTGYNSYAHVGTVNGSGWIEGINHASEGGVWGEIKIVVDGTVLYEGYTWYSGGVGAMSILNGPVRFENSFSVHHKCNTSGGRVTTFVTYKKL